MTRELAAETTVAKLMPRAMDMNVDNHETAAVYPKTAMCHLLLFYFHQFCFGEVFDPFVPFGHVTID